MYENLRNYKTSIFDEKIKSQIEELIEYGFGYSALANALNLRGIPTRRGQAWTIDAVRQTLKRLNLKTL